MIGVNAIQITYHNYYCFANRPVLYANTSPWIFLSIWQLSLWCFYLHALLHLATHYMDELAQCSDAGCIT